MRKKSLILGTLILILLTGCSNKTSESIEPVSSSLEMATESFEGNSFSGSLDMNNESTENITNTEDFIVENNIKVIKRADLSLETDKFDEVMGMIEEYISSVNGYIESSNAYQEGVNDGNYKNNRTAEFIIRVPQESFEKVLNKYGELGVVTNKRVYGDDISSDYFDKESRLEVLRVQESKYLELLNKAETVTEVIEIEKVLTEVRYEIEYLTGYLKKIDNLTSLSTINLYVYEVYKTNEIISEPKTFWEKAVNTFNESIKALGNLLTGMLLFAIAAIPFIIVPIITAIVAFVIYKKVIKKKDKIISKNDDNK